MIVEASPGHTLHDPGDLRFLVLAATATEVRPLRRRLRGRADVRVLRTGVGAPHVATLPNSLPGRAVISCGLAGGLDPELASGTVVIPAAVADGLGVVHRCDAKLVDRLRGAAQRLGVEPDTRPLVTVDHIVSGKERALWWSRGYAAADMESARMVEGWERFAAVRIVLDTPQQELSPAWRRPVLALLTPRLWGQALWLAGTAPRRCDLGALIVAAATASPPTGRGPDRSAPPARRAGSPR